MSYKNSSGLSRADKLNADYVLQNKALEHIFEVQSYIKQNPSFTFSDTPVLRFFGMTEKHFVKFNLIFIYYYIEVVLAMQSASKVSFCLKYLLSIER